MAKTSSRALVAVGDNISVDMGLLHVNYVLKGRFHLKLMHLPVMPASEEPTPPM